MKASHPPAIACQHLIEETYTEVAYAYDGSVEGLLTAVFKAYEYREDPTDVRPEQLLQPRLGQYVRDIQTDFALAERVAIGICKRCGQDTFDLVKKAATCCDDEAGTDVYRFIRYAMRRGSQALYEIANPLVAPMEKRRIMVNNECEYMRQFVRFQELEGGLYFARISPKAKVIPLVMDWFSARFNTQAFIIYDEAHHMAGVYEGPGTLAAQTHMWGNPQWYLVPVNQEEDLNIPSITQHEAAMQHAWKRFYAATTVAARYNPELRMHLMPKRFWRNLIEMQEELPSLARRT